MRLKFLSVADAKGWYRVRGTRETHEIEKIAAWAVIARCKNGKKRNHAIVGILPADMGHSDYGYDYFVEDVVGYVHESELVDDFVNAEAFKRLNWPKSKRKKVKKGAKGKKAQKPLQSKPKSKETTESVGDVNTSNLYQNNAGSYANSGNLLFSDAGDRGWIADKSQQSGTE